MTEFCKVFNCGLPIYHSGYCKQHFFKKKDIPKPKFPKRKKWSGPSKYAKENGLWENKVE